MFSFLHQLPRTISSQINVKRFGMALLVVILMFILWVFREELRQAITAMGDREALVSYLEPYGTLGIFLFYVFLFLQVFIATIPGQAIMITGGYLYGFWIGLFIIFTLISLGFWRLVGPKLEEKYLQVQI